MRYVYQRIRLTEKLNVRMCGKSDYIFLYICYQIYLVANEIVSNSTKMSIVTEKVVINFR
jgi:hypothetical protein